MYLTWLPYCLSFSSQTWMHLNPIRLSCRAGPRMSFASPDSFTDDLADVIQGLLPSLPEMPGRNIQFWLVVVWKLKVTEDKSEKITFAQQVQSLWTRLSLHRPKTQTSLMCHILSYNLWMYPCSTALTSKLWFLLFEEIHLGRQLMGVWSSYGMAVPSLKIWGLILLPVGWVTGPTYMLFADRWLEDSPAICWKQRNWHPGDFSTNLRPTTLSPHLSDLCWCSNHWDRHLGTLVGILFRYLSLQPSSSRP